ncbi:hypothetical protein V500_05816 [Pseudogymnoascus sp. VKM F-4518 (FW-2643)]|nr:hypothetical protein V500_05816 [Pseudogymnoascus sp. VKM F-4518 (FW-2643)]
MTANTNLPVSLTRASTFLADKARDLKPLHSECLWVPKPITTNACLGCGRERAKGDGKKPCTCSNARADMGSWVYDVHTDEKLMKYIHKLRAEDELNDRILKALQSDDQTYVLYALRNGESLESIGEGLDRALVGQESSSPIGSLDLPFGGCDCDEDQILGYSWTNVVHDSTLLDHLFQLYFAWVHPVYTLFSEGHFVESYRGYKHQHCSSLLVNALCALACHYHTPSEDNEVDYNQLGIQFADAFYASFEPGDKSMTSIQATAVMFLVGIARGSGLRASAYLRLASDNIAEISSSAVIELPEWAQVTFQSPIRLGFHSVEETCDGEASLDESLWYFYQYEGDHCPAWPALLATTNREKMKLINIISDASTMMYGPYPETITAHHILEKYGRFVAWRMALPHIIGDVEASSQALPHILSLLILYDYSIVQLLHPLIDFEGFPSMPVEEVAWTHAQHALFLLERHYRTHYTCRHQTVLQMFAISSICGLIARFFPTKSTNDYAIKDGPEAIALGLEILQESCTGFPVAGKIQELLRREAVGCSVRPPLGYLLAPPRSPRQTYSYRDLMDACTRPSYRQPLWGVREKFSKELAEDWYKHGPEYGFK